MKILLDTHIVLWTFYNVENLSDKAKNLIQNPDNTVFYSVVSAWEVLLKHTRHPDDPYYDLNRFWEGCSALGFISLKLDDKHVRMVETLSLSADAPEHRDPFDKLLLAQAKSENIMFLTHDSKMTFYNEPCVICV